jgi:iron donor protein CyaY
MMIDEQEFRKHADEALEDLSQALIDAGDAYGFETDFNSGALTVDFENPAGRFVVSPNAPVRQIWLSALSKSFKLDWDPHRHAFVLPESGESLKDVIAARIGEQIGEDIAL